LYRILPEEERTMPYAFIEDVPAQEEHYAEVRAKLGDEPPDGLIAHIAVRHGEGLRYFDVWETEAAWLRFRDECVRPAVGEVFARHGVVPDEALVRFEEMHVIDTWLGTQPARIGR
jgi:hypothetical protein